ncbi:MAG: substrate-binding domain-containing protein [Akkermansiaceae bacterium]|jgi:ribose transport system substrate-binding protein|nr:substrate-binding domain-containing protein [Akkermansiaceae bacterium]
MKSSFFLALAAGALLSGCNKSGESSDQLRIAVIPKGTTHIYWKSVEAGAMKAADELGVKVTFIGPQREDDRSQQIDLVKNQSLQNDAVVLAPLDAVALRDAAKEVADKGKPVVIIDSSLADGSAFIASYVATDNVECGRIGARAIAASIGEKGKVAMLRYMQGSASTEQREQGFLEEIAKYPGIEVVSSEQFAGATASDAQNTATNLVTRLTEGGEMTVQGIFCSNQTSTYGMLQALRGKNLAGKVKFVGVDCDATFIDALKKGEMQGTVLQDPVNMGYLGVKTAVSKLKGETVEAVIDTGATLVTPDNLADPKIDALVKTQLQ